MLSSALPFPLVVVGQWCVVYLSTVFTPGTLSVYALPSALSCCYLPQTLKPVGSWGMSSCPCTSGCGNCQSWISLITLAGGKSKPTLSSVLKVGSSEVHSLVDCLMALQTRFLRKPHNQPGISPQQVWLLSLSQRSLTTDKLIVCTCPSLPPQWTLLAVFHSVPVLVWH